MDEKRKRHLFRDSWLWRLLATYIFSLHRLFYKVIVVEGRKNIPVGGPLIFAPNHQNALMDPLAVLFASSRQIVFLARADIFKNPWLRSVFYWMKILPVYRIRDGRDNLQNNELSFDIAIEVMEHGRSIGLFPEAAHSNKRHILPIKKGVPRLAFMAEERNDFRLGIKIVPVGIYYSHYESMGSILHVKFGEPISVSDFSEEFYANPQKAHLVLRDALSIALRNLAIDIKSIDWYETYDTILILKVKSLARKLNHTKNLRVKEYIARKKIIESLDEQLEKNPDGMASLRTQIEEFLSLANRMKIKGNFLAEPARRLPRLAITSLLWIACLPVFLYALINHLPGYFIPQRLVKLFKDKQFHSSVKFLWGALFLPIFYLLQSLLVLLIFKNNWIALYYAVSLPVSGLFAHWLLRKFRILSGRWKLLWLKWNKPARFNEFLALRKSILKDIDFLLNL